MQSNVRGPRYVKKSFICLEEKTMTPCWEKLSNYYYNWRSLKYRIRLPLVVARYRPIRWIKPDKWDLGRKRVV